MYRVLNIPAVWDGSFGNLCFNGAISFKEVAQLSYDTERLVRFCKSWFNVNGKGIAYDSEEARGIDGAITAIMTGVSYKTSAELQAYLVLLISTKKNKNICYVFCVTTRAAAYDAAMLTRGIEIKPTGINAKYCLIFIKKQLPKPGRCSTEGEKYGYRNAQTTVIAQQVLWLEWIAIPPVLKPDLHWLN